MDYPKVISECLQSAVPGLPLAQLSHFQQCLAQKGVLPVTDAERAHALCLGANVVAMYGLAATMDEVSDLMVEVANQSLSAARNLEAVP